MLKTSRIKICGMQLIYIIHESEFVQLCTRQVVLSKCTSVRYLYKRSVDVHRYLHVSCLRWFHVHGVRLVAVGHDVVHQDCLTDRYAFHHFFVRTPKFGSHLRAVRCQYNICTAPVFIIPRRNLCLTSSIFLK
jgi:hypothetical protein